MDEKMILTPVSMEDLKGMIDEAVRSAMEGVTPKKDRSENRIFGIQGLAKFINCSEPKAVELARSKRFNRYQDGRKIFFLESEVLEGLKR